MELTVKYLNGETDNIKAAEHRLENGWFNFLDADDKFVATIKADQVRIITRAQEAQGNGGTSPKVRLSDNF